MLTTTNVFLKSGDRAMMMTQEVKPMNKEKQEAMQACKACYKMCLECMAYCMQMGDQYMEGLMLRDCAEMCQMCINMMTMGSVFVERTCSFCAEVCLRCAESCEAIGDDAKLKACAECCRSCAQMCQEMSMMKVA
jgi:hypothetical protein